MKIYKIAIISNVFIRGENAESLTKATGEAGWGYYFSPLQYKEMIKYYTESSKHVWEARPKPECNIEDLTTPEHIKGIIDVANKNSSRLKEQMRYYVEPKFNKGNYQRNPYAIEEYVKLKFPNVDAYLVLHKGTNAPTGKQLVILNLDAFDLKQIS